MLFSSPPGFSAAAGFQPLMPLCLSLVGPVRDPSDFSLNGGCRLRVTALDFGQGQCNILQAGTPS
jgi:hypothetical protein